MQNGIQLIIGLGNPGPDYEKTRHNAGAWFVENLAADNHVVLKTEKKFKAQVGKFVHQSQTCYLVIPTTYMNHSGQALAACANYFKVAAKNILVAHDELDFPNGQCRLKFAGGHGGHNGLRDIFNHLQTADFWRLRIGIGHPGHKSLVTNYVLNKPSAEQQQKINMKLHEANAILPELLKGDFEKAMGILHQTDE